jgi:hypothetical protein
MAGALSRVLAPPQTWAEELCLLRNPDLAEGKGSSLCATIVLSHSLRQLAEWDVDLRDVRADLSSGLWIRRGQPHPDGTRFWLQGDRYEVEVLSKRSEQNLRMIALVRRITRVPANTVPRRAGRIWRQVYFEDVRGEPPCDIGALHEEAQRADRLRAARASADRVVHRAHRDPQLAQHDGLHAAARSRYGALRALLSLLALRAERSAVTAEGVITTADDDSVGTPFLYVRLEQVDGKLNEFNDAYLEIDGATRKARTRVRNLSDRVIAVDMPRHGKWEPGARVTLTTVPRFTMNQHDRALQRFLRGEVEGDWDSLAALLCDPKLLDLRSRPLPPRFFCDEDPEDDPLNEAQRLAVAGALATPHAFVIQGPPGTGKTTVICEIIRQLVARGQRVLMLAPQHVAVDEVLVRVGRKPGIRALRLAWDEGKVGEHLRGFLPERAAGEFVSALRRPGPGSDEHWAARQAGLAAELGAVDRLTAVLDQRDQAGRALAGARQAHASVQRRIAAARAAHHADVQQRGEDVAAAGQVFREAARAAQQAQRAQAQAQAGFSAVRQPVDHLAAAVHELQAAVAELAEATVAKTEAEHQYVQYRQRWTAALEHAGRALAASEEPWRSATQAAAAAVDQLRAATARLAELRGQDRAGRGLLDRLGIGPVARRQSKVERTRNHWAARERERERWDGERQRWLAEQQRLSADTTLGELAQRIKQAGERLRAGTLSRHRASARWREASYAACGEALPEPQQPEVVARALRAVLSEPASSPPLPAQLTPATFRQAHESLRAAAAARQERMDAQAAAQRLFEAAGQALRDAQASGQAVLEQFAGDDSAAARRVRDCEIGLEQVMRQLSDPAIALGYAEPPDSGELAGRREDLRRKIRVLPRYPELRRRWLELVGGLSDEQLADDTSDALFRSVNVVCATTQGITGRSAYSARDADFDTLIVDEASRVIDSEFLIGAARARRWILVGDERQLPPYVEQGDEFYLHALAALDRHERGDSVSLDESVRHLAELWSEEDAEQRQFRGSEVLKLAEDLRARGEWPRDYQQAFAEARQYFRGTDPDREFLRAMRDHLIRSLLERVAAGSRRSLREALVIQRRMIEPMAKIVKGPVYKGQYETPPAAELRERGVYPLITQFFQRPIVFLDSSVLGKEKQVGHGFVNELECEWIAEACRRYESELTGNDRVTVSIVCFYLAQALRIREKLGAPRYRRFRRLVFERVDPIDKIQGQQSDLVFISFSRSQPHPGKNFGRWLQDVRRLNVACTRARRALVLVGHGEMLRQLHSSEAAQEFYRNLFSLFDQFPDHFMHLKDL